MAKRFLKRLTSQPVQVPAPDPIKLHWCGACFYWKQQGQHKDYGRCQNPSSVWSGCEKHIQETCDAFIQKPYSCSTCKFYHQSLCLNPEAVKYGFKVAPSMGCWHHKKTS